ncbi:MAG: hypothetical protein OXC17_06320 [Aestuariivita sp.]|nr:hypothetical protein [Aestuariivita sp.]
MSKDDDYEEVRTSFDGIKFLRLYNETVREKLEAKPDRRTNLEKA